MDRITKQFVTELIKTQEIKNKSESDNFEFFVNFSVISNEYNRTFNIEDVSIGSGHDTGIDGLAIIVNGTIVTSIDEVDNYLETNGFLDVTYIFVQSKISSSFDTSEIRTFSDGVKDFFLETPTLPRNNDIQNLADISNYILDNASSFKENPKCKLYFVTTGVYNNIDQNIKSVKENTIRDLINYNLFEDIEFKILGGNEIGKLYRKSKNPISTKFTFSNKVTLDDIEGIPQAYYGILPFSEFKKLIIDDNVRDFQGSSNPVNAKISETLESENPFLFSVVNNGVTVVANEIKTSGNTFTILNYQIVNECQTSNVLFEHRNLEKIQSLNIPIRLIGTNEEKIKSNITVLTNNQTAIKQEQLSAMSDFQKIFKYYYKSIEGDGKLYYERRSKQYNTDSNVIKRRIITTQTQTKDLFTQAIEIIDNSGIDINDKQYIKSKGITESLIAEFNKKDENV